MAKKPHGQVANLDQAVKAFGGRRKMRAIFGEDAFPFSNWWKVGVPRHHELGLYMLLKRRGFEPMPALFSLESWDELETWNAKCKGAGP